MINPVQQNHTVSTTLNTPKSEKETKTNNTQKTENDKVSKIAEQVKNGTYKIDVGATATAIADSLL
ncbi:flagellar biosynthesis anti-sigma factor FlgM [Campylobacter sp. VicNov18]|uniref:flagellar biosynthesis anti-sigma factor FlgM n=1 Tax=Campylobacter bilis TaxID=2691918 RepID=UPI00130E16EC|nr:flagellar biosynthesis anti-sigma factor FlgM [Campylobacter bilis]MPV63971.1 flagellar biosynthesis anti-sigma factor FlgM [Campylobacter hepaticus]MBM0637472.1 flagellar biosynthesis anti-sigma factor FlgM [Campylobacter bilis]MCC8278191.1 flagellar biosynthesis anti-sigma factor FlgM [Campylobacter bilis]MCC8299695.1 flagellar biosynthesis anti-sigma factor FlgM [Campylobacter bilis]MCC8301100.1 flagellar biosynthesis anti-sigma factor FlgM [Campylobacter bilis]